MAKILWHNNSSHDIKWMAFVNGQWQGSGLAPQQSSTMDDSGVLAYGWALSGFMGITYSTPPSNNPSGYSALNFAVDFPDKNDEPLINIEGLLAAE